MKQAITILFLILLGIKQEGISQQSKPVLPDNVKILNAGSGYLNTINMRAHRDFLSRHEDATNVVWYKADKGFIVRFFVDSIFARSAYKTNGSWVYTIKQYMEAKMPKEVR